MNILFLTQEYPPETAMGGVGIYTYNLARELTRLGHMVHVVTSAPAGQPTYEYEHDGVRVHRIRRWKFEVPVLRRLWYNALPWTKHQWEYLYGVAGALRRIVRQYRIDIIESTELWAEGLLYSFIRQAPILVKLHTPLFLLRRFNQVRTTLDWRIVDFTDKIWTRRADCLVAASRALAEIVGREYVLDANRIAVIPAAVDTQRFTPEGGEQEAGSGRQEAREERDAPPEHLNWVLFVGQLEPRKGIFTLADAMPHVLSEYSEARFVFLGRDRVIDGHSCREMLLAQMHAHGVADRAVLLGDVPNEALPAYYRRAAVCVFPSMWENCAIACLEAMACGRPVIASHAGGFPEMIEDGVSGLLVPPGHAQALANAICRVLRHPLQAREWGIHARSRVEQSFSQEVVARQNLEVYEQTIQAFRRQGRGRKEATR